MSDDNIVPMRAISFDEMREAVLTLYDLGWDGQGSMSDAIRAHKQKPQPTHMHGAGDDNSECPACQA